MQSLDDVIAVLTKIKESSFEHRKHQRIISVDVIDGIAQFFNFPHRYRRKVEHIELTRELWNAETEANKKSKTLNSILL